MSTCLMVSDSNIDKYFVGLLFSERSDYFFG